jgi:hypothetical protein
MVVCAVPGALIPRCLLAPGRVLTTILSED